MAETDTPPWELLPVPALEAIFRHLCVPQLRQMRLMCRQWNSAICHSPKLMGNFCPTFCGDQTVFRTASLEEQLDMVKTTTARFPGALIDVENVGPVAVSPLWARIGQSIRSIIVSCESTKKLYNGASYESFEKFLEEESCETYGELSVAKLVQMLRVLPNLRSLQLDIPSTKVKFDLEDGAKLDQLERIHTTVCDSRLVELLSKICPNLQIFKCFCSCKSGICKFYVTLSGTVSENIIEPSGALSIISEHQDSLRKTSLKNLSTNPGTWLTKTPSVISGFLKELTLELKCWYGTIKKQDILLLSKAFPALETLKLKLAIVDSKCLEDLRRNMQQLRSLAICLKRDNIDQANDLKAFLEKSPQLEKLSVYFQGQAHTYNEKEWIDLRGLNGINLRKLTFMNFSHRNDYLEGFFSSCSNVTHLRLSDIYTFEMDSAVATLQYMKSLEFLEIFVEVTPDNNEENFEHFGGDLLSVRSVRTNCLAIARCCPNSKIVELHYDSYVQCCWDGILETLESIPKVVQLSMSYKNNSTDNIDEDLGVIASHGRKFTNLKKLYLEIKRHTSTETARDALTEALRNFADVQINIIEK